MKERLIARIASISNKELFFKEQSHHKYLMFDIREKQKYFGATFIKQYEDETLEFDIQSAYEGIDFNTLNVGTNVRLFISRQIIAELIVQKRYFLPVTKQDWKVLPFIRLSKFR